jgi:hypothetical protein
MEMERHHSGAEAAIPDPYRLGGLQWTRNSGGWLTSSERRKLLAAMAFGQWQNMVGRAKLKMGRTPAGAGTVPQSPA